MIFYYFLKSSILVNEWLFINKADNENDDNDGEDHDEDEHIVQEIDPRFLDEGEEDQARQNRPPQQGLWHDDRWQEIVVQDNPIIQRRFHLPVPAPYVPEVNIHGAGAKSIPLGTLSESSFMELFYDNEILGHYVEQTNIKVSKQPEQRRAWDNDNILTVTELKKYLAVDLYMDIVVREGDIRGYWSKDMWGDAFVQSVFSRQRYLAIRTNLTWMDTTDITLADRAARNAADGFWTITGLFDTIRSKFKKYFTPYSKLSIDEICVFLKEGTDADATIHQSQTSGTLKFMLYVMRLMDMFTIGFYIVARMSVAHRNSLLPSIQ